ncbi:MAG TPA: hypothetical protein VFH17_06110, partial [Coriobacteriia bacterium]|nr:hypothetical protein [Coriobacteriia bacterium]
MIAAIGAAALGAVVIWGFADAADDPLARSSPDEVALRTARLAGIMHAVAGSTGEVSVVRLDLPAPASAQDVGIAWLSGLGLLAGAYPGSDSYVVQVFADGAPLVEYVTPADRLREAVETGDIETVRAGSSVSFIAELEAVRVPPVDVTPPFAGNFVPPEETDRALALLSTVPRGATRLPGDAVAIDIHLPGGYLDAKNRAAGLVGGEGLTVEQGVRIAE